MDDGRVPSIEEQNLADLAAAFGNHQITDEEGQLAEETAEQNTAPVETNSEEETAPAEKPAKESKSSTQEADDSDETELAVDESGKRYIPEGRLKKETKKRRDAERKAEALQAYINSQTQVAKPTSAQQSNSQVNFSPAEDVELEFLYTKYPQFDSESSEYSYALDSLGAQIYKANPGISRLKAAKLAIEKAREITQDQVRIASEAKTVKALQSDQGITNRVTSHRGPTQVDPERMTLQEKEEWMKANGLW